MLTTLNERPHQGSGGQTSRIWLRSAGLGPTRWLFAPVLAPLLQRVKLVRVLAVVGLIQMVFTATGPFGWPCPLKSALGIPCPGCGLSTAVTLLVRGDVQRAVRAHAAAPMALAGLVLLAACSLLPDARRRQVTRAVGRLEERMGIVPLMIIGSLIYWAARCCSGY